jgi:hypothetical protein
MNAHHWGDLADDEAAAALLGHAMSTIDNRAEYGDARLVEAEELRLYHQLGRDPDERLEKSIGIGVRVLVDGSRGFAAAHRRGPARLALNPGLSGQRLSSGAYWRAWRSEPATAFLRTTTSSLPRLTARPLPRCENGRHHATTDTGWAKRSGSRSRAAHWGTGWYGRTGPILCS